MKGKLCDLIKQGLIAEGDTLKCIDTMGLNKYWTQGKEYEVFSDSNGLHVFNNRGARRKHTPVVFEIVAATVATPPTPTPTTVKGEALEDVLETAKEGELLQCVFSNSPWWTVGNYYEVIPGITGSLCIEDDDGDLAFVQGKSLFINVGKGPSYDWTSVERTPDTWDELATGGAVKAPTKEWEPDTINPSIDTSKKLRDW